MRTRVVDGADGVRITTTAVGDPDAPVVLFGHGVGSSSGFLLEAFGPALVGAGWQVVAHDLRGHGASTPCLHASDYDLDRLVADLDRLVEVFAPRVLAGVSLSAHVVVRYAARQSHALAAVVACLPAWTGASESGVGPHAVVAETVDGVGVPAMIQHFRTDDGLRPWLRDVLTRDWATHDEASLVAALRSLDGGEAPTLDDLRTLAAPLALVGWPDDPGHPLEVAARWRDAARRAWLEPIALSDLDDDLIRFGQAAAAALEGLGVHP